MRRVALAGIVVLALLVGGTTVGLFALTTEDRPADATVTTFEPRVAVGNESEGALAGSGEVVTCNERGPMPGDAGLVGRLVVERPTGDDGPQEAAFQATVTVGDGELVETRSLTLSPGQSERMTLFTIDDRPASLTGGESVTVRAHLTTENETVATATRAVDVSERDVPCADERGS